ncbi:MULTISPECIES: sigma-70 family RNA polymerase sigma factor [Salinivibrio]|uniref:sigma-70 family RNA polymerase sigma factor n=1 Tax=Salinivibrio TaxID=51366 RepID=UPI00098977ED|nr:MULTISPECIES: sigma-70 family RNA polymerase sigma factor [Salinivibrio]OOF11825.1 RNA polymerase subunit sigma [Salinivibrio sp. PR5]OOF18746.1 RNA polymerase subunit sigma [Salinivibrio sp. PR932]OOF30962.1 RNA polymerase subunit sigma [Salinivibrio proteolyticus]
MIGSQQALHQGVTSLYVSHQRWLSGFIQRRMGCPSTSADLVQDTYLRLLNSGRLPDTDSARAYLTHIAKGLIVDWYRRRRVEQAYLDYLQAQPERMASSPEQHQQTMEALVAVDALLGHLPVKVRQALLMRQLEGMSYKDIAKALSVSVSSVEKYVAKALTACVLAAQE